MAEHLLDAARHVHLAEVPGDLAMLHEQALDAEAEVAREAVAVAADTPLPDISTEESLRRAVCAAPSISYSTGPSGAALTRLFERWGIAEDIQARMVLAPPGVPVGSLVASGAVALGFQQLSELMALPGIDVLGTLPADIAFITTFSSGIPTVIASDAVRVAAVQSFLQFLASADVEDVKRKQGMDWL